MFDFCVLTLSLQLCCNHLVLVVLRVFVYSFEFPTLMIMLSVNRDVVCTFFFLFFLSHSLQKLVLSVQCWEVMVRWDISSFGLLSGKVSFFLIINYDISYSFFFFLNNLYRRKFFLFLVYLEFYHVKVMDCVRCFFCICWLIMWFLFLACWCDRRH